LNYKSTSVQKNGQTNGQTAMPHSGMAHKKPDSKAYDDRSRINHDRSTSTKQMWWLL